MTVYLDYHSTTPVDIRVAEAMKPFYSERFGNPAALHAAGLDAQEAVEEARERVAKIINAEPEQIYFTSSATMANNIILKGRLSNFRLTEKDGAAFFITSNTEHSSINKTISRIMKDENLYLRGVYAPYIKVKNDGTIDYNDLDALINNFKDRLLLVSIIAANNEIGTIHDLDRIGDLCKKHNVLFHTDATQAIGKVSVDVKKSNIYALTMSGHKIYGPKGIGALYVRNRAFIEPLLDGGYQDILSSGTQNVPAIVGLGKACEIIKEEEHIHNARIESLRNRLWDLLREGIDDIFINGTMEKRLPNNLNVTIKDIQAEILVKGMEDVIVSGGSACESGALDPSHVILALQTPYPDCAIRISLGRNTTEDDIIYAANRIIEVVKSIRE